MMRREIVITVLIFSLFATIMICIQKEGVAMDSPKDTAGFAKAIFAAGCFWGIEAAFSEVPGVIKTTVGYAGGNFTNPSYEDVCSGRTGHAEAVEVIFDPNKVSYEKLLDVFWSIHNPTTPNRQGPDVGYQYRSAIFYFTEEQKIAAEKSKEMLEKTGKFGNPIVTQIVPASKFYKAEEYHQQYHKKHGMTSCRAL
jgi:peptide-methionine (S)-S-oxide reductase